MPGSTGVTTVAVPTSEPSARQLTGFAANVASGQAFCSVVKREGSCLGSSTNTDFMFASCAGWVRLTCRLAPFSFEVFALVAVLNDGLNASALQLPTWKGVDRPCVALNVEVSVDSVARAPQLVGLKMNEGRFTSTFSVFSRTGTPPTIVGSVPGVPAGGVATVTRAVCGSTLIVARVVTVPRLNGPATTATGIERP